MKKTFEFEKLGRAHCASKMETAIRKIDGVSSASINYIMKKLTIEAEDAVFDEVLSKAVKACKKIEPDCKIVL